MKFFILVFNVLIMCSYGQQNVNEKCLLQISLDSVMVDSSLDENIRSFFEDDDGEKLLRSFEADLNEDGYFEKFIPNEFLCGSGGCPWIIYDTKSKKILGRVDAKIIYVDNKKILKYFQIETLWRMGGSEFIVKNYSFKDGEYSEDFKSILNKQQMLEYIKHK